MENYKQDIINTRTGCLGSSDGKLLLAISILGIMPKMGYERMAVVKGLIPNKQIPRTNAVEYGDIIEQEIYRNLVANDGKNQWESNPLWESEKYSKPHVKLICHPDIVRVDNESRTIFIYEVKTTRHTIAETKETYKPQLFIHYMLGKEKVRFLKGKWKVRVFLVHYSTKGLDIDNATILPPFDTARLTISEIHFKGMFIDIEKAMTVADRFLETFNEYYAGEEIDAEFLPTEVRSEFNHVTNVLAEIKQREEEVEEFKKRLYAFLSEKGIKSIKSDTFTVTRVDDTETKTFDGKKFISDYIASHPRKGAALRDKYTKTTQRKGYVNIKIKNQ